MGTLQILLTLMGIIGGMISLVTAVVNRQKSAVMISGILLMAVGLIVLVGYLARVPAIYTFPQQGIGMALPTAILFFITGGCLFILSTEVEFKDRDRKPK